MRTTIDPDTAGTPHATARDALANLGRAVGSLRCAGSQRLVRLGISMTHFHVLTLLRHHDAMPMGKLADILDASMSSATGIIDRMEERGLVERVRVPDDRRIVLVRPTQAGLDLVDEVELVKSEVMEDAIARLDPAQLERLTAATADLGTAIALVLAQQPGHDGLATCNHAHGPNDGPHVSAARASNLHGLPTPTPQSRDTIDVAPALPSLPVARHEPALKEG
jgi:MarR family 2-MHQ and catechol resistance regulon transcriptional repressor